MGPDLLDLDVASVLGHANGSLPPEPEGQPDDPVEDTPNDLGGKFIAVNRIQLYTATRQKANTTYASN